MERRRLEKILFSDESMFCVSYGNQGIRVWRMKQEAFDKECLKRSENLLLVSWFGGCIRAEGPRKL